MKSLKWILSAAGLALLLTCCPAQAADPELPDVAASNLRSEAQRRWKAKGPYRNRAKCDKKVKELKDDGYEAKAVRKNGAWWAYYR